MRIVTLATTLAIAIAFVTFSATSSKAEQNLMAGGSISGKVVDVDGNPVEGAKVRVMVAPAGKPKKEKLEDGDAPKPDKPAKPQAVAEAVTDAAGAFKVDGIPAGDYMVAANAKGKGMGKAKVTVADGQTAEVTLELKAPAPKKPKEAPAE
jgi:protocatechuate 3,4-dioxygenase beta subunit